MVDSKPAAAVLTPVFPERLMEVEAVVAPERFTAPNVEVKLKTFVVIVPVGSVIVPPELTVTELLPLTEPFTATFAAAEPSAFKVTLVPLTAPLMLTVPVVAPPLVVSRDTLPLAPAPLLETFPVTVISLPNVFSVTVLVPAKVSPAPTVVVPFAVVVTGPSNVKVPAVNELGAPASPIVSVPVPSGAMLTWLAATFANPVVPTVLDDELSKTCSGELAAGEAIVTVEPAALMLDAAIPMSLN